MFRETDYYQYSRDLNGCPAVCCESGHEKTDARLRDKRPTKKSSPWMTASVRERERVSEQTRKVQMWQTAKQLLLKRQNMLIFILGSKNRKKEYNGMREDESNAYYTSTKLLS